MSTLYLPRKDFTTDRAQHLANARALEDWAATYRIPVVATASLPAAGTAEDGRVLIEDAGAGDRNLIIFAGGQRFRIDGGAAF